MTLTGQDLALGRAARYLLARRTGRPDDPSEELAARLLSCKITDLSPGSGYCFIDIFAPRDMYEILWAIKDETTKVPSGTSVAQSLVFQAMREGAAGLHGSASLHLRPAYGAAGRDAEAQTELYMYVFGDDPVGQQVQVLDTGPHSAPTRQLIVSPVPVLPVSEVKRDDRLCFVVMPFAQQFRPVYDYAIAPAVTAAGLTCRRGDDISQPGAILTQIWQSILQARLVVADLSGANGNVLYELGLAHVLGHEAILLAQNIADVPFDLRHQRTIVYTMTHEGVEALRTSLMAAIQTSLAGSRR